MRCAARLAPPFSICPASRRPLRRRNCRWPSLPWLEWKRNRQPKAKSIQQRGGEWFQLESVTHTTRPSMDQFDRLLTDGTVTMDHLIKRKPSGGAAEKGPLFKIETPRLGELFLGEPRKYSLVP